MSAAVFKWSSGTTIMMMMMMIDATMWWHMMIFIFIIIYTTSAAVHRHNKHRYRTITIEMCVCAWKHSLIQSFANEMCWSIEIWIDDDRGWPHHSDHILHLHTFSIFQRENSVHFSSTQNVSHFQFTHRQHVLTSNSLRNAPNKRPIGSRLPGHIFENCYRQVNK